MGLAAKSDTHTPYIAPHTETPIAPAAELDAFAKGKGKGRRPLPRVQWRSAL